MCVSILLTAPINSQNYITAIYSLDFIHRLYASIGGPSGPSIEASSIDRTQQIRFT
jgi:hypothetical protein